MSAEMSAKRFRIAFSFAGEKRAFVAQVAAILAKKFSEDKILTSTTKPNSRTGSSAYFCRNTTTITRA
jgi:hypothetical protein